MTLIRNNKQVKQAVDFSGVQNGVIHPSDIDAVLEFDGKVIILFEVKRVGNEIPTGQRLLLERIADRFEYGFVLKVEHNFFDDSVDIPLHTCKVTSIYYKSKWNDTQRDVVEVLNSIGEKLNINKLKNIK
jgi:hypothetical protein